jgi:hypothetical protein
MPPFKFCTTVTKPARQPRLRSSEGWCRGGIPAEQLTRRYYGAICSVENGATQHATHLKSGKRWNSMVHRNELTLLGLHDQSGTVNSWSLLATKRTLLDG